MLWNRRKIIRKYAVNVLGKYSSFMKHILMQSTHFGDFILVKDQSFSTGIILTLLNEAQCPKRGF